MPGDHVGDPLETLGRVIGRERPHEDRDLAPVGEQRDNPAAQHLAGLVVVGSDVEQPLGLGRIRVEGDEVGLLGDLVEQRNLIVRRDGADGDGGVPLAGQILQDLVLALGGALREDRGLGLPGQSAIL